MEENNEVLMLPQEVSPPLSFHFSACLKQKFQGLLWLLKVQQSGLRASDCSEMRGFHLSFKSTASHSVSFEYYMLTALEWIWTYLPCSPDCIADLIPYLNISDTIILAGRKVCIINEYMFILYCLIKTCSIECVS